MILGDHTAPNVGYRPQVRQARSCSGNFAYRILPGQPAPLAYWVNRMSAATVVAPTGLGRVSGPGPDGGPSGEVEET